METIVYLVSLACFTLIICVAMWKQGDIQQVNLYKGRNLALHRQLKEYEKTANKVFKKKDQQTLFAKLGVDEIIGEQIMGFAKEWGIPEKAIVGIAKNPEILKKLFENLKIGAAAKPNEGV